MIRIIGHVPNLIGATFNVKLERSIHDVVKFLETSPKLEVLDLVFETRIRPHPKMNELQNRINANWNVRETPSGCAIRRKTQSSPDQFD